MTDLQNSISDLYDVFGQYFSWSRERDINVPAPEAMLRKNLKELTSTDLDEYAFSALVTWGDVSDFRHFLPRLLELSTEQPSLEVIFSRQVGFLFEKLALAGWCEWPIVEQNAIERFLKAWWQDSLDSYPSLRSIPEVLVGIACVHPRITPFLEHWLTKTTPSAFQHIADSHADLLTYGSPWIKPLQRKEIRSWLFARTTMTWLESGFFQYSDESWGSKLAEAIDNVQLQAAYSQAEQI